MKPKPTVYLNYNSRDRSRVAEVHERLMAEGFQPWWDADLLPGQNWRSAMEEAMDSADFFLALFTRDRQASLGGHADEELMLALENQPKRQTSSNVFVIPARLEPCEVHPKLRHILWVDLDSEEGWQKLLKTLGKEASQQLGVPQPPPQLADACRKGNCVLYAGAGLSAPAGFPTWNQLVPSLLQWAKSAGALLPRSGQPLEGAIKAGDLDLAADSVVSEVEKTNQLAHMHGFLRTTFDKNVPLTARHKLIRELDFSAVLTTNFDTLLERTFPHAGGRVFTPLDIEKLLELSAKREFFIAKLYGSLVRPETLLVSPAQYKDAIIGNRRFAEFIESIFVSRTLLFLGSSLDGISAYLEGIRFRGGEQRHFALVAVSSSAWQAKATMLSRRYGIDVLPYTESKDHAEVDEFLRTLFDSVKPAKEALAPGGYRGRPKATTRAQLKRILLKDIGPFAELELGLTPNWNILLGDNGVGKTTILRAIALAMCGRDAQGYAQRMVRSGQSKAQITLETDGGRKYVTEIYRTSSGFEVESLPRRPLDTEGWLVLGFPPVRSATWGKSSGPQGEQTNPRPMIEDLLPLLSGEPDPRLDEVKQWIVNLDYWKSKGESMRLHPPEYYEGLQKRLFEIIQRLTGGVKINFEGVDPKSWEVIVATDDGIVPIDAVSQGTASVIGWTGVLVQRLFALFESDANPLKQHAIVILDEIDAHMHPVWQQSLISALSELFPNVQFIATTHSPLIVGGMPVEQVTRFVRDESGRVVVAELAEDATYGRPDQVLTGDAFGLNTWLDETTRKETTRYQQLLGNRERTPEEEEEFQQIRKAIRVRIPMSASEPAERLAQDVVRTILQEQLGGDFPEAHKAVEERVRNLLTDIQKRQKQRSS